MENMVDTMKEIETYQWGFKSQVTERVERLLHNARKAKPSICIERARIWTESYKETEGETSIIRRAKALSKTLREMSIYILEGELIVGNHSSKPRASVVTPEYHTTWLIKELNDPEIAPDIRTFDHHEVSAEVKRELLEDILSYWEGKTVEDAVVRDLSSETIRATLPSLSDVHTVPPAPEIHLRNGMGHLNVNYAKLIRRGALSIINEASERFERLDELQKEETDFYQAIIIIYRALIDWAGRYAQLALAQVKTEKSPTRQQELEEIARVCSHVPANPARTFWEALQTFWFIQLILFGLEQDDTACSPGRMDQYLYPYYEADVREGRLNKDEALELIELLYIKTSHMSKLWDYAPARYYGGFSLTQCIIVGGVNEDGSDSTNDLSYMFLEAEKQIGLYQPELAVRIHKRSPHKFLMKTADVIRMGRGKPKIFVDETAIPMLLKRGMTLEEARDYCIVGCVEVSPSGSLAGWTNASMFNLAKCLELAMNSGVCMITGKKVGPKTQDPKTFTSISQVIEAFGIQLDYFVEQMVLTLNTIIDHHAKIAQCPFTSSLTDGCLESGKDFTEGGAKYNSIGVNAVAIPDVADSLAALDKLVFTEKKLNMYKLLELLRNNFECNEDLRQMLIHRAPKYGNNEDLVDRYALLVGRMYCKAVECYEGPFNIKYWPGVFTVSANVPLGLNTAALPSGRRSTTPLADGGISPTHEAEAKGPTSIIQSATKLDHIAACNGTLLNMRFSPSVLKDERDLSKMVSLLKTYAAMGGFHIQFNVIGSKILRDAQKKPNRYRNLMVRVAGYSAYFTELSPEVQEDIITRAIYSEFS